MNVEIGVTVAAVQVRAVMVEPTVRTSVRFVAAVLSRASSSVTPILAFLRQGKSSMTAVPGDLNFISRGGSAVLV